MHCTTLMRQLKCETCVVAIIGNTLVNNSLNKHAYKQSPSAKIFTFSLPLKLTLRRAFLTKTSNFRF